MGRGSIPWLLAWLASAAGWMALVDSVRLAELLAGVAVATLAASGFEVVRRQRVAAQAMRPELSLRVVVVVGRAVPDVWRLTRLAFAQLFDRRPVRGRIVALPFGYNADEPDDRARRAVAVGLGSIAPNTLLVGVDPERGLLVAHQLDVTGNPGDLDPMHLR
jgi:multisubunit Na+/H+ antiporter MnhE subunit